MTKALYYNHHFGRVIENTRRDGSDIEVTVRFSDLENLEVVENKKQRL